MIYNVNSAVSGTRQEEEDKKAEALVRERG